MTHNVPSAAATQRIDPLSIGLSREEVFIVLRLLKASGMPGYDVAWLNITPDGRVPERHRAALEAATTGLVARGYLLPRPAPAPVQTNGAPTAPAVELPDVLVALVGACAFGEYAIMLDLRGAKGPQRLYLHELRGLGVLHDMPLNNVHQLSALDGRNGVLAALESALAIVGQPESSVAPASLAVNSLTAASEAAKAHQRDAALQSLLQGGLPAHFAPMVVDALTTATTSGTLVIFQPTRSGDNQGRTVAGVRVGPQLTEATIVVTPQVILLFTPQPNNPNAVTVAAIGAGGLRRWVSARLP